MTGVVPLAIGATGDNTGCGNSGSRLCFGGVTPNVVANKLVLLLEVECSIEGLHLHAHIRKHHY